MVIPVNGYDWIILNTLEFTPYLWRKRHLGKIPGLSNFILVEIKLDHLYVAQAVRRSRRIQGLEALEEKNKTEQAIQVSIGRQIFQPFRNPSVFFFFFGEPGHNPEKWLKEFHRVARYNHWDNTMWLANVYFFLSGTARSWFENIEEQVNSWDSFETMLSLTFGHHTNQKKLDSKIKIPSSEKKKRTL
ncbi:hypothetical protein LAZ67_21001456 [Cordylochernes scorpioides]|uniref:Retrotransposon gag domain-containing protein n=1 Tax=Cordylochernes scorpioides TaxID=51811 RepID=A0ABY6LM68_9ARAC|nr:hypothetical protein LAZ67_21001456 [Cordylochernes scorpioides]